MHERAVAIGTDVSHGCIRLDNVVIRRLARLLALGTPVHIGSTPSKLVVSGR